MVAVRRKKASLAGNNFDASAIALISAISDNLETILSVIRYLGSNISKVYHIAQLSRSLSRNDIMNYLWTRSSAGQSAALTLPRSQVRSLSGPPMKKALICGAGGFIGSHLAKQLKKEGYWVRGVDLKKPEYSPSASDDFQLLDLSVRKNCTKALTINGGFDEVYQLAADRGGIGYLIKGECVMMTNNALINIYMVSEAVKLKKLPLYFFSSSACIYRDMLPNDPPITEDGAYPALPDNEYGWEKLYSERLITAFGRHYKLPFRIARFQTVYGPESNWEGGREKAPDALCRKTAMAQNGTPIEVWGDGKSIRVFTYIDDLIRGIRLLMKSSLQEAVNLGSPERVTIADLAKTVIKVSGKKLSIKYIDGPVGVHGRNFSLDKIYSTGWHHKYSLEQGLKIHYPWVKEQVIKKYGRVD
jgi:GDP-D-mannose 3',5'-epimerase